VTVLLEHDSSFSSNLIFEVSGVEAHGAGLELGEDLLVSVQVGAQVRGDADVAKIVKSLVELANSIWHVDVWQCIGHHKVIIFRLDRWRPGRSVLPTHRLADIVVSARDAGAKESKSDDAHDVEEEWAHKTWPGVNTVGVFVGHEIRRG